MKSLDYKQQIHDDAYSRKTAFQPRKGIIPFLHSRLSRFETGYYQVVADLLPKHGKRLLDVGCGSGDFLYSLKGRFQEYYGIDISPLRIEQSKGKPDKYNFQQGDADEGLPYKKSFFDAATCLLILERAVNPPNLVKEIHRILKKDGVLIVQVPNIAWFPRRVQLLFGKLPATEGVYDGADWNCLHTFTKKSLTLLLESKGFTVDSWTCSGILAEQRSRWLSLLSGNLIVKATKQ